MSEHTVTKGSFDKIAHQSFRQSVKSILAFCAVLLCAGCAQESDPVPEQNSEQKPDSVLLHNTDVILPPVDRDIPDFSLARMDGEVIDTESLQGKTWLINFWAVWCAPCLEELPSLNSAWKKLEPHNVGMLAINIGEEPDQIKQFLAEHNLAIDFPIVIGDKIRTLGNWSARALPHTVVISPEGRVVYEVSGPREWDDREIIDAILELTGKS